MTIVKEFNFSAPGKYTIQAYYTEAENAKSLLVEKLGLAEDNIKIKENIFEIVQDFKDQSHLSGVLTALNDLHFTILTVQRTGRFREYYY
jgi:hypothetical protein